MASAKKAIGIMDFSKESIQKAERAGRYSRISEEKAFEEAWKKKMLKRIMKGVAKTQEPLDKAIFVMCTSGVIVEVRDLLRTGRVNGRKINRLLKPMEEVGKVWRERGIRK